MRDQAIQSGRVHRARRMTRAMASGTSDVDLPQTLRPHCLRVVFACK
jgi:hypothetical protein